MGELFECFINFYVFRHIAAAHEECPVVFDSQKLDRPFRIPKNYITTLAILAINIHAAPAWGEYQVAAPTWRDWREFHIVPVCFHKYLQCDLPAGSACSESALS